MFLQFPFQPSQILILDLLECVLEGVLLFFQLPTDIINGIALSFDLFRLLVQMVTNGFHFFF